MRVSRRRIEGWSVPATDEPALRWVYRASIVIAVAPVIVVAFRKGLDHWEPTWDAATTAIRIRDVFSAHPPLIGFVASPSITANHLYNFPGALELYLLAVPVKLFGTTWGLLLGMAVINVTLLVVALWLIRRRVGERGAILACAFVASLLWALGSEVIVNPTPLQMVALPFFTFLVAVWSVADGDGPALFVLAFVGNYLVLDQLIFTLLVPALGVVALVYWIGFLRRTHRASPQRWASVRRNQGRWCIAALAVTTLVWIPPLYDQFGHSGGNLGKLMHAFLHGSGADTGMVAHKTFWGALGMVISVTAQHRLWLPTSFAHKSVDLTGGGSSVWARTVAGVVLLTIVVALLIWARARRDRTIGRGLVVAVVAWLAWAATAFLNPSHGQFVPAYYTGLWPLSAFLWLVIVLAVLRCVPWPRMRGWLTHPVVFRATGVPVVVLALLAIPTANKCSVKCAELLGPQAEMARDLRTATARQIKGGGPIEMVMRDGLFPYQPSVLLGLQDNGVHFRLSAPFYVGLYGASRNARVLRDARVRLYLTTPANAPEKGRFVATIKSPKHLSSERFEEADHKMHRWAGSLTSLELDPHLDIPPPLRQAINEGLKRIFESTRSKPDRLLSDPTFLSLLASVEGTRSGAPIVVPGLTAQQVRNWATDTRSALGLNGIALTEVPVG